MNFRIPGRLSTTVMIANVDQINTHTHRKLNKSSFSPVNFILYISNLATQVWPQVASGVSVVFRCAGFCPHCQCFCRENKFLTFVFGIRGQKHWSTPPPTPHPASFSRFQSRSGDQVEGGSEEHQVEQPQQEGQRAQPGEPVLADDVIHLVAFVPWTTWQQLLPVHCTRTPEVTMMTGGQAAMRNSSHQLPEPRPSRGDERPPDSCRRQVPTNKSSWLTWWRKILTSCRVVFFPSQHTANVPMT